MESNQLFSSELVSKIQSIKKLLEEDSSIDKKAGEYLILTYLHTCNGDVKRTKEKIITYFQYKKQFPRIMKERDILDDYSLSHHNKCLLTTDINQEQLEFPLVVVNNLSNASDMNAYEALNCLINFMHMFILHSERLRKHGAFIIINVGAMPFNLLFQFTPTYIYETVKSLLVVVYSGSWDCLKDEIPSESLPIEYGGTNGTLDEYNAQLMPIMTKWRDVILNQF
ncbi:hypothetical protein CHUAL_002846 [Chamberlinius hualienensis]